jgi:hypothetical protein
MTFPIILKPKSVSFPSRKTVSDYDKEIIEVPNLIPVELANELTAFATDIDSSGLHRRGSKNLNTSASFYTCLVFRYDNPIYNVLEHVWSKYAQKIDPELTFIEPYEIKMYVEGDKFDNHHDSCGVVETMMCRKMNVIVQLSDESDYDGGDLLIGSHKFTRTVGTGIFFPADVDHAVTPITRGTRFSLIGHAWGPYNIKK